LLAIVALPLFFKLRFWLAKKIERQKRNPVLRSIMLQNIEITHDLIAAADRGADHAQRIINLKN
jgi:hypothetical protein